MLNEHGAAACEPVHVCVPMLTVPERAPAGFAAAAIVTVPLPVPDAPPVTASQLGALLVADHEHQLPVVTATLAVSPDALSDELAGEIVKAHAAAACEAV